MTDPTSDPDLEYILTEMEAAFPDRRLVIEDPSDALRWLVETAQDLEQVDPEGLAMVTTLAQKLVTLARISTE